MKAIRWLALALCAVAGSAVGVRPAAGDDKQAPSDKKEAPADDKKALPDDKDVPPPDDKKAPADDKKAAADEKAAAAAAEKEAKKQREEAVKKCLDEFKKSFKEAKSVNERAAAVRMLGNCEAKDPKIIAQIAAFLAFDPSDKEALLACTAADALGTFTKNKAAAQALMRAAPAHKKNSRALERILSALGDVGDESAIPVLVDHLRDNDATVAKGAAQGLGGIPSAQVIEPLIKTLDRLERDKKSADVNVGGGAPGLPGGAGEAAKDGRARYDAVAPAVLGSLKKVTGETYGFLEDWQQWWAKNRATFKPAKKDGAQ